MGRSILTSFFLASLAWASVVLTIGTARADEPMTCTVDEARQISCTVEVASEFDADLRQILESGFTNNLVYRIYLFSVDREEPLSLSIVAFAQVFRLYTDVYYISREGTEGYVAREDWSSAVAELSRFTVEFEAVANDNPGEYFAAAILEINPLSEEHLAEARSWIAQSRSGYRLFGMENQSFFGTFVSLFINANRRSAELIRYFRSTHFEIIP